MQKPRRLVELTSASLFVAAIAACSSEPPAAPAAAGPLSADTAGDAPNTRTLSARLSATGYTVQEGRFTRLDMTACCATSCAGNNPSSPYFAFFVPPAPGGIPDPKPDTDGMASAFRMDANEALVFVGVTPPEVRYFGFTPYLTDRATPDGGRRSIAASLSETLNDLVIRTTSNANVFGQTTAVIAAMNDGARNAAMNALVASGVPLSAINTIVFDPATVIPGLDANADTLSVLFRVAVPTDKSALDAWVASPNAHVYRLSPTAPPKSTTPLKVQGRVKNRSNTETPLTSAVDRLRDAIIAQHPGYVASDVNVDDGVPDPSACIAGTAICAFDNRDTTYPATSPRVLFQSDDDFYVAYGVDHQVSGKVSYANVSVYAMEHLVGLESVASPSYPGSAAAVLGDADPDAAKLFAWRIARSCGSDPFCMTVDKGACPSGIENGKLGSIAFRTYLEPSSKTAPLPSTLVRDRILRFRKP